MKLNRNGINNLVIIIACFAVIVMISMNVPPLCIFGVLGAYAIYLGIQTIYYQEVPRKGDYSEITDKKKYCIHNGVWMMLLGLGFIGLSIAHVAGLSETYFWGGILFCIIIVFFYNSVVRRTFIRGYKSNLAKIIELIKGGRR